MDNINKYKMVKRMIRRFTTLLLLALILVIGSCATQTNNKVPDFKQYFSKCLDIKDKNAKMYCTYGLAIVTGNGTMCDYDTNNYQCRALVALANNDLSVCNGITASKASEGIMVSKETNVAFCYTLIATSRKDVTICDNMDKSIGASIKMSEFTLDISAKNTCYSQVAIAKNDTTICKKIQVQSTTDTGKDYCYTWIAISKHDSSLCTDVINDYPKQVCSRGTQSNS